MVELNRLSSSEQARQNIRELEKAHRAVMAAHGDMLKLLSNQQMDIALQKFETEVAPRLQDISVAAKRMIENQSKDLERMSRATSEQKATTNVIMIALVGLGLLAGLWFCSPFVAGLPRFGA